METSTDYFNEAEDKQTTAEDKSDQSTGRSEPRRKNV